MSHGETSTDTASFLAFHLLGAAVSDEGICIYNSEVPTTPTFHKLKIHFCISKFNFIFTSVLLQFIISSTKNSTKSIIQHNFLGPIMYCFSWTYILASLMTGWWSIDCGSSSSRVVDGSISWEIDTNYTKAGSNMRVPQNQALDEMNTLRFFPNQTDNNCYVIPLKFPGFNHIVRAGFYYGNYDGLSKTPTFDLKIDRENWTTVNTSSSVDGGLPIYHEAICLTRSGNLTVCLVQTMDREVPFISSLEGVPIRNIYEEVLDTTTATLHLVARTNFGGSEVR